MNISNFKKLISISKNCYESNPCKHQFTYLDNNDCIQKKVIDANLIWNFCYENSLLQELDYNTFVHLSKYCSNKILVDEIGKSLISKIKNNGMLTMKNSNLSDLLDIKHSNPKFSYTCKLEISSGRIVSELSKLDLFRKKDEYICSWKNINKNKYFFKSIKLIDSNDNFIDPKKIEKLEFILDNKVIITWYGISILENESFKLENMYPLVTNYCSFRIKTDFKIQEVYVCVCYEDLDFNPKHYVREFIELDYDELYNSQLNQHITLHSDNSYYKSIRFVIVNSTTGERINPLLIKRLTVGNLLKNIPTSLLTISDNILIYDLSNEIIEKCSTGFVLKDNERVELEFRDEIYNIDCSNLELKVYGSKYVKHTVNMFDLQEIDLSV